MDGQHVASVFYTPTEEVGRFGRRDCPRGRGIAQHGARPPGEGRSHAPQASPRPPFTLGASAHATRQSRCLRPAPTGTEAHVRHVPLTQANPTRNFWAVSQAESARNATQRRRFPRSAEPTANNPRRKPHRSPGLMAKSAPISCETAQKSRGRDREQGRDGRKLQRGRNRR